MIDVIKEIASNVLYSHNFSSFYTGVVTNTSPITIALEDGLVIDENFILLSRCVTNFEEKGKIELTVCEAPKQWYDFNLVWEKALEVGENVVLVKENGGQRYLVVDRLAGGDEE